MIGFIVDTNHPILQAIIPGRPGGSVFTNLLGGELVWATKSKCKALALKDALDAAGEAKEEQGEHQDHVWIFHFSTFLFGFCFFFNVWVRLVFVEKGHDKATHD